VEHAQELEKIADEEPGFQFSEAQLNPPTLHNMIEMVGKDLLATNGTQTQMGQLGCELSELSIALFQHFQQGSKSIDVVASELADVLNMLPQIQQVMEELGATDLVDSYRAMKLERIRHRLKHQLIQKDFVDD